VSAPLKLRVLRPSFFGVEPQPRPAPPGTIERSFSEIKSWLRDGTILKHLFRYAEVEIATASLQHVAKPFPTALLVRALSHGPCFFTGDAGERLALDARRIAAYGLLFVRDFARIPVLLSSVRRRIQRLTSAATPPGPPLDLSRPILYLRADLRFGVRSGGSVGHTAGVLNCLHHFAPPPIFVTTDRVPTVRDDIETHVVTPGSDFCGFEELPGLHFNRVLTARALQALAGRRVAFVYQRYCLDNFSGLELARRLEVPIVLEYNGSELWMSRHWGRPLRYRRTALRIESSLLRNADLVAVVSRPLKDELLSRGLREDSILVNPNGVDPDVYSPAVDGTPVRRRHGLDGKRVLGFIGTFGPWHGAEVLAEAFGRLVTRRPEWRHSARLLMIGDGLTTPQVDAALQRHGVRDLAILTGSVPQHAGPEHLAACDVLVSPHVRNPDGTPFFGSPTKVFEYMAMGKGIVASNLDQIGDILRHGETAWLVEPGDVEALVSGLQHLLADQPLARRLGEAARGEALARHTWKEHVHRIVEALRIRSAGALAH
jgi:glycosyltransferase involved in cell wall biosynthesis